LEVLPFCGINILCGKIEFLKKKHRYVIILMAIIIYGLLLEYLQIFVGRSFDMFDLLADIGGIIAIKNPGKNSRVKIKSIK
jgi:VanZ family protein